MYPDALQEAAVNRWRLLIMIAFLSVVLLPQRTDAQPSNTAYSLTGYVKNLALRTSTPFTRESAFLNISRFRLKNSLDIGSWFHAEVWLDTEMLAGGFLASNDYSVSQGLQTAPFFDLDWTIATAEKASLRQQLFRATATFYVGDVHLTAGRQRIAWGTGFAWNPTDLFNPFNPASLELDEKAGIDAVHAYIPLGSLSHIEAAFAPGRMNNQTSAALRATSNFGEYDISLMTGIFRDDFVVGGDFAGYLGNAGLRGEWAVTWIDGSSSIRTALNADYNFEGGYYTMIEWHHNGPGATDPSEYNYGRLFSGELLNVAQDYLALSMGKAITPLLSFGFYSLLNLNDQSGLMGPSLGYSISDNLEVSAAAYLFPGKDQSEYGLLNNIYFGSLQIYF